MFRGMANAMPQLARPAEKRGAAGNERELLRRVPVDSVDDPFDSDAARIQRTIGMLKKHLHHHFEAASSGLGDGSRPPAALLLLKFVCDEARQLILHVRNEVADSFLTQPQPAPHSRRRQGPCLLNRHSLVIQTSDLGSEEDTCELEKKVLRILNRFSSGICDTIQDGGEAGGP